jgi:hypothetical protein
MKMLLCVLLAMAILPACASVNNEPASSASLTENTSADTLPATPASTSDAPGTDSDKTLPKSSVGFFDATTFDRELSTDLREDSPDVTVYFHAPASVNAIPERLGKWLTMVEKYGGTVEPREDPDYGTRGFITSGVSIAFGAFMELYRMVRESLLYKPVKDYNAIVYYSKVDGTMTKVVFTRKTAAR